MRVKANHVLSACSRRPRAPRANASLKRPVSFQPGDRCAASQRAQGIGLTTLRGAPRLPPPSLLPKLEVRPGVGRGNSRPVDANAFLGKK